MRTLARPSAVTGIALASAGMIAFTQFPVPDAQTPVFGSANVAVQLVASPIESGFAPVATLASLAFSDGSGDALGAISGSAAAAALLPDIGDLAPGDLLSPLSAGLGDFDPLSLLLAPVIAFGFVLSLFPLFLTASGSLLAFLMYQFSPGAMAATDGFGDIPSGAAEAVAADPALSGSLVDTSSLVNGLDLSNVSSSMGDSASSLLAHLGSDSGSLLSGALADSAVMF